VSTHRFFVPVAKCGMTIGAMRIKAPFPADGGPLLYHGLPTFILAINCLTVFPIPEIRSRQNRCHGFPG